METTMLDCHHRDSTPDRLTTLPPEPLYAIMDQLHIPDMARMRAVNKQAGEVIRTNSSAVLARVRKTQSAIFREAMSPICYKGVALLDALRMHVRKCGLPVFDAAHYERLAHDFGDQYYEQNRATSDPSYDWRPAIFAVVLLVSNAGLHQSVSPSCYVASYRPDSYRDAIVELACEKLLLDAFQPSFDQLLATARPYLPDLSDAATLNIFNNIREVPLTGNLLTLEDIQSRTGDLTLALGTASEQADDECVTGSSKARSLRFTGLPRLPRQMAYVPKSSRTRHLVDRYMQKRSDHLLLALIWEEMRVFRIV